MKTILTLAISIFLLTMVSESKAQQSMLATNAIVQTDFESNTIADLSTFEVREYETRVYFKVKVKNGDVPGVLVLEHSSNGEEYEIIDFKDMVPVTIGSEILYCFNDGVTSGEVSYYRITVATAEYSETIGSYIYGVANDELTTNKSLVTTTVY